MDSTTLISYSIGMSQNGSAAWSIGPVGWDYRQILSHYYRKVQIGSQNNDNRWVWLNVNDNIVFTGYESSEKYKEVAPFTPGLMRTSRVMTLPVQIQNTGDVAWAATGANAVLLAYRWYNSQGSPVPVVGEQTSLTEDIPPGGVIKLQVPLRAPRTGCSSCNNCATPSCPTSSIRRLSSNTANTHIAAGEGVTASPAHPLTPSCPML